MSNLKRAVYEDLQTFDVNGQNVALSVQATFNKQTGQFQIGTRITTKMVSPNEAEFNALLSGRLLPALQRMGREMLGLRAGWLEENPQDDEPVLPFPEEDEDQSDNDHQMDATTQLSFTAPKKRSNAKQVAVPAGEDDELDF